MQIEKYLVCICLALGLANVLQAQGNNNSSAAFPRISFTYDFNMLSSDDDTHGPRIQIFSNHRFFGNQIAKRNSTDNLIAYAYGGGLGFYTIKSMKEKGRDNEMYHFYAMFMFSYRNRSRFEPFAGINPGINWGAKSGAFINPTAGLNITTFHINRNWNSKLLQVYTQLHAEYNTSLSCMFLGGGLILQFQ